MRNFLLVFFVFPALLFAQNYIHRNNLNNRSENRVPSFDQRISSQQELQSASNKEEIPDYLPNEIIIKYKSLNRTEIRGSEILDEHKNITQIVEQIVNSKISFKPVFRDIIEKMVNKDLKESELLSNEFNVNKNSDIHLRNKNIQSNLSRYSFSNIIKIKIQNTNANMDDVIKNLLENKNKFNLYGYELVYAEPNYLKFINAVPNDPLYSIQWAHKKTQAELGWDTETGDQNVIISIIDTGIDIYHEDLGNYTPNTGYDYVDIDTAYYRKLGYSLISQEDYTEFDPIPADFNGHGTHCAGIVGASGNNMIGISGVCQKCKLLPVRAGFSIKYGTQEYGALENDDIANAIHFAVTHGADIISMSFGGTDISQLEQDAINFAYENNVILIAAAGNNANSIKSYPAAFENVISVAASDQNDKRASFSNYGTWITLCAPGVSIFSTVPKTNGICADPSGYKYLSGTSMAAPYVAGLAGLLLSNNPGLNPDEIKRILINSVDNPEEQNQYIGAGRVNVYKALQTNIEQIPEVNLAISSPTEGDFFIANVNISGSADVDNYKLEYGYGIYPKNWITLNTGSRKVNDLLGIFDITNLSDGKYTIKLSAPDVGDQFTRTSIVISNARDLKAGWPIHLPVYNNDYPAYLNQFSVADLNGDNEKEIIVVGGINSYRLDRVVQSLYIFNAKGELMRNIDLPFDGYTTTPPVLVDIDSDGKKEIILLIMAGVNSPIFGNGYIQILKNDGTQFPGWPQIINAPDHVINIAIADMDLDGKLDIITATGGASCTYCSRLGEIHVFNNKGQYLPNWPYKLPDNYIPRSNIVLANLDNEPAPEITFTAFHNSDPNNNTQYIYALKSDATIVDGFPHSMNSAWSWPLAASDLDNDAIIELMTQTGLINNKGQKLSWGHSNSYLFSNISIADVDNNNDREVLYGDADYKLYLTDKNGKTLPGFPFRLGDFTADGNHIIADINNDHIPELIVLWVANTNASVGQKPGLYVYNVDGSLVDGFPRFQDVAQIKSVVVDDIDNDNFTDILALSDDNRIFALSMNNGFSSSTSDWPMLLHDPWLTGSNIGLKSKVLSDFSEFTINEDDSLLIRISPYYIKWENYNSSFTSDNENISYSFNNGILKLKPNLYWYGDANISMSVSNSLMEETKNFNLKITHKNHQPFLSQSFPQCEINEDTSSALLISDLDQYFSDHDTDDKLSISCIALDRGLDSLKISNINIPQGQNEIKTTKLLQKVLNKNETKILKISKVLQDLEDNLGLIVYPTKYFYGNIRLLITATDDSLSSVSDTLLLNVKHVNHSPTITPLSDITIPEDSLIQLHVAAQDIDNDVLSYEVKAIDGKINFHVKGDSLNILPVNNWNGSTSLIIKVSDGYASDSTFLNLSVIPVNDKPFGFNIIYPTNNKKYNLLADTLEHIDFRWSKAKDVEEDSIFYSFSLSDSVHSLFITNIKDTVLELNCSIFKDWIKNAERNYKWSVYAYDYLDSTEAENNSFSLVLSDIVSGVSDENIPEQFALYQNYPNPFNPVTIIKYDLPEESFVRIEIYDLLGKMITIIKNEYQKAGAYQIKFDASHFASGLYIYRIHTEKFVQSKKMVLLR